MYHVRCMYINKIEKNHTLTFINHKKQNAAYDKNYI